MTASRARRIDGPETRLAADDSVQAEDAAATAFIARIFLDAGGTPERLRQIARCEGYEFLGELADAMEQAIES